MSTQIELVFTDKARKLMKDLGISSEKDLINNALSLYEYSLKAKKEGFEFGAYDPKNDSFKSVEIIRK